MNTISFPKIFKGKSSNVIKDSNEATLSCLHLLLSSECGELFGDPEFGINLRRYLYEQNNYVLKDILIDEIYTKICTFCPQLYLERRNIKVEQIGSKFYAQISCKNQENFQVNTYNLVLFDTEEKE